MTYEDFKDQVLARPGAAERVAALQQTMLVGHDLRLARKRAGISQKELAQRLGVSQPRIAAIERANENVTLATVARYAAAVGVKLRIDLTEPAPATAGLPRRSGSRAVRDSRIQEPVAPTPARRPPEVTVA